ncbi:MAG: vitamin B12-dependent ribonucleotide reductase [Chloroflexi bacterium]|nr:vitamin B12-dependent ribonucleotide reductase [Chloroflexota bacterium]
MHEGGTTYPDLSDNALAVLRKRYFLKDRVDHPVEDTDEFFDRVVRGVVDVEHERGWVDAEGHAEIVDAMYDLLRGLRFVPNSPCLMNAGKPQGYAQMAACFVLPIDDDLLSIKTTDMHAAIIHQSGGGTGFNFSRIRPRGDFVRSSGGVASGPISFMSMIDYSCGEIKQGGTRRGANMGILNVDHPDILDFIECKTEDGRIANFNISVGITDAFMQAVRDDTDYELVNPRTGEVTKRLRARDVWDRLVDGAWLNGEPGMIFLDRLERTNPTPDVALQDTTNPCGEQPLLPYEACVLGSLNLNWHLTEDRTRIDWNALRRDVKLSVRFLDDMVEASNFPLKEIDDIVKHGNRRVGLGVMGWADVLFHLGLPYDCPEAEALASDVMQFINDEGRRASEELAAARGAFPNFTNSAWDRKGHAERRNATVTTIAPTGTISMIADASSGIEPLFALIFWKNVMRDSDDNAATTLRYVNPIFETYARRRGFFSEELVDAIEANHGSLRITDETPADALQVLEGVPESARRIFVTAHDVSPEWHIRIQSAFQAHTENAVSKTINFPHEATREDVERGYWRAYELGCKGVTVYRDGSRDFQVLTTSDSGDNTRRDESDEPQAAEAPAPVEEAPAPVAAASVNGHGNGHAPELTPAPAPNGASDDHADRTPLPIVAAVERERPDQIHGTTTRIRTGCGPLFVTINDDERGLPFETFATLGKAGGCAAAQTEAIGRLASLALRSGVPVAEVQKTLRGITCHRPAGFGPDRVLSCGDGIAQAMARRIDVENGDFVPMVDLQGEGTYTPGPADLAEQPAAAVAPASHQGVSTFGSGSAPAAESYVEGAAHDQGFVGACPSCGGSQLHYAEGCMKCVSCGYSDCG